MCAAVGNGDDVKCGWCSFGAPGFSQVFVITTQKMSRVTLVGRASVSVSVCVPLQPNSNYMYRQFNIQQFYVLPTQCIYVFCVDLRTNSGYFPIQH